MNFIKLKNIILGLQNKFGYLKGLKYFKLGAAAAAVAVVATTGYAYHVHVTKYEAPIGYNISKNTIDKKKANTASDKKVDLGLTASSANDSNTTNSTNAVTPAAQPSNKPAAPAVNNSNTQTSNSGSGSPTTTQKAAASSGSSQATPTKDTPTPTPAPAPKPTPAPAPTPTRQSGIDYALAQKINAGEISQWEGGFDNGADPKTSAMVQSAINISQGGGPVDSIKTTWHTFGSNGGNAIAYKSSAVNVVAHDSQAYYTRFTEGRGFFYAVPYWDASINDYKMIYVTINMF